MAGLQPARGTTAARPASSCRWWGQGQARPICQEAAHLPVEYTVRIVPHLPVAVCHAARRSDAMVNKCAQFRTSTVGPCVAGPQKWSFLWRSSPSHRVGVSVTRSTADEQMLAEIRKTNPSSTSLYICDCRPKVKRYANRAKGGGLSFLATIAIQSYTSRKLEIFT